MSIFRRLAANLLDPGPWSAFFARSSYAGKAVNSNSALTISAVFACIRLLAQIGAIVPLKVYERLPDDGKGRSRKREASDHWLYGLLHDAPNFDQLPVNFFEALIGSLCLWGNAYVEIERNGASYPASLSFLYPELVEWRRENGRLRYWYNDNGRKREIEEDRMWHIRGFGFGDAGLSVIRFAIQTFGNALAAEETAGRFFGSGLNASGIIEVPTTLKKETRQILRDNMREFQGSAEAGKVMIFEGGMKFHNISMPLEDAQLLETRRFSVEDVCRWFGVQPFMIGHSDKSTTWGTGLEQTNLMFLMYGLDPILVRIEQSARKLLPAKDRRRIVPEYKREALTRLDAQGQSALFSSAAQNGIMSRNEIRAAKNLEPSDDPMMDAFTVQSNLVPIGDLGKSGNADGTQKLIGQMLLRLNDANEEIAKLQAGGDRVPGIAA